MPHDEKKIEELTKLMGNVITTIKKGAPKSEYKEWFEMYLKQYAEHMVQQRDKQILELFDAITDVIKREHN